MRDPTGRRVDGGLGVLAPVATVDVGPVDQVVPGPAGQGPRGGDPRVGDGGRVEIRGQGGISARCGWARSPGCAIMISVGLRMAVRGHGRNGGAVRLHDHSREPSGAVGVGGPRRRRLVRYRPYQRTARWRMATFRAFAGSTDHHRRPPGVDGAGGCRGYWGRSRSRSSGSTVENGADSLPRLPIFSGPVGWR